MSSKPREWPNVAKEARDRAAECANHALYQIEYVLDHRCSETEKIEKLSISARSLNKALRFLEGVGAPTRPV